MSAAEKIEGFLSLLARSGINSIEVPIGYDYHNRVFSWDMEFVHKLPEWLLTSHTKCD